MKHFNVINQAKFFLAALNQQQGELQLRSFMQGAGGVFFDTLGETVKPKIRAVLLPSAGSTVQMGLYQQSQGRRPGRKREVPNTLKVGGLVVDESVAPAHGLFEYCPDLDKDMPFPPVFSTSVRQIIRTDGKTWLALVREAETNIFTVSEEFALPAFRHGLEWAMPMQGGVLFDAPQELYGFIEFLRRAMFVADNISTFAKKIASYGRELVYWLMAAEDTTRLEWFVHEFYTRYGLRIGTLNPELQAAKILTYCIFLDAAMETIDAQSSSEDWFSIAQCTGHDTPIEIVKTITQAFQENKESLFPVLNKNGPSHLSGMYDAHIREFCETLWGELRGNNVGTGAFSCDREWVRETLVAASAELQRSTTRAIIVTVGSQAGNSAVDAVVTALEENKSPTVYSGDPDPIALQTSRLRLVASRYSLGERGTNITFHCALGNPLLPDAISLAAHSLFLFCDCIPNFPSGAKPAGDEFSRRFGFAADFIHKYGHAVISLRMPADFLDGKEYVDMRRRLFASGRALWVRYDETQERPRDKRLARAVATVILDAADEEVVTPSEEYVNVPANPEMQFSLMPPRLSGGYLSWPAVTDIAAMPPLNGPIERRGMALIDTDADALSQRVREYLSPNLTNEYIADRYPPMMKNTGRFNAALTRQKLRDKAVFNAESIAPYPFRPFDERFAYLREMRPLFSDPSPDLQVIASLPDNWFLLASEGDEGIGDGVAAWASTRPCDYDYFAGRSRHFPVRVPNALLNGQPLRTSHGGWEHPAQLHPKANLSPEARRFLEQLDYPDPDNDDDSARLLWDYCLAVLYTPAYGEENQTALRLGWPRMPLPGWGKRSAPRGTRELIKDYAALGAKIRSILSGMELEYKNTLSGMAEVRLCRGDTPVSPSELYDEQRILSTDWGVPAKGNAVRARSGALANKYTDGALLKRIFELADAMNLSHADCLERLGQNCVDVQINYEAYWADIPGAAWDFTIGGRKILQKWLSYRDFRVIHRPMLPQEMERFSDIARRLVVLTLLGIQLDAMWPKLLDACKL